MNALEHTEHLPVFDNGYFDALVAIGFAALADSYFDTPKSPHIERTPAGFQVTYARVRRDPPDLGWLKYSLAASWKNKPELQEGTTFKAPGWDQQKVIYTEGAVVDTSDDQEIQITIGDRITSIKAPERTLYGVINKLGKPDWVNLCIYACRHRGIELLEGHFEEKTITFNSIVLPQASKGANASNSFSIGNGSLSGSLSTKMSRLTVLAVAGLIRSASGQSPIGFAVPVPHDLRLEDLKRIVQANRERFINGGIFFPYDTYLSYLKLLLTYDLPRYSLGAVAGANFVELGTAASPSGSWQLAVPRHQYQFNSADRLQKLLLRWKIALRPKPKSDPSVDREAVRRLVRGFESSDPAAAAEGYLSYVTAVGLISGTYRFYPLSQSFFEEIMSLTYSALLQEFQREEVRSFIDLIRRETYNAVYPPPGQPQGQPNYQMMRRLREVQSDEDFVQAITEIATERGITKLAAAKSEQDTMKFFAMPYEPSLIHLTHLAEQYKNPRLIAQLLLAFALCRRSGEQTTESETGSEDSE